MNFVVLLGLNCALACLCLASVSPLAAGYMLSGGNSWRLYFYVILAFSIAMFLAAFLFFEETSYDRARVVAAESNIMGPTANHEHEKGQETRTEVVGHPALIPNRKSYIQTLSLRGRLDREIPLFTTIWRSFTYLLVPQALWVITTYGIYIGQGAFAIGFSFPIKIMAPPYNWDVVSRTIQR
jgi:hypothetical protein